MLDAIILHGSSSVGKTYMMNALLAEDQTISGWEMDDCKYWLDYEPSLSEEATSLITGVSSTSDVDEFMTLFGQEPPGRRRCVAHFLSRLPEVLGDGRTSDAEATVLVTVGALPPPPDEGRPSVYAWLATHLPISFLHVLIEIPEDRHLEQMARRGRLHLRDEILANNARRVARRDRHDLVIADLDELRSIVRRDRVGPTRCTGHAEIERNHG